MAPFTVIILAPLLLCLVISDMFAIDVSLLSPNAQPAGPSPVAQPSATGGFNYDYMTGGQLVKPNPVPVGPRPVAQPSATGGVNPDYMTWGQSVKPDSVPVDPVPVPVAPVPVPVDPVPMPVESEPILVGPDTVVKPEKPGNTSVVNFTPPPSVKLVNPDTTTGKVSLKIKTLAMCNASLSKIPKQRFFI